jgi:transcriptional regulator with XRE-family HTH domain
MSPATIAPRPPVTSGSVGAMLRDWREDRRRSQMHLALDVGVSTRHLSFVETGKSKPSPELVLAIAEHLDVPLRERNAMLLAAGYAPRYRHTPLDDEALSSVRWALGELIRAHDPYPALVVDRHWNMVMANDGALGLVANVAPHLIEPPLNVYRVTLHPEGMAPLIDNLDEWAHHLLGTLDRQVAITRDPELRSLLDEVSSYPNIAALDHEWRTRSSIPTVVVPLRMRVPDGEGGSLVYSWFSTNTSIGTPADITLDELHVELFHPADEATAALVGGRTAR